MQHPVLSDLKAHVKIEKLANRLILFAVKMQILPFVSALESQTSSNTMFRSLGATITNGLHDAVRLAVVVVLSCSWGRGAISN